MIHPTAHIGAGVVFKGLVTIGPFASIDGDGSLILIGDGVVIGTGARIGQAGFGYETGSDGTFVPKPHEFGVILEDGVHVGANACIDRGSWRDTLIGAGTKIDNLVHIAHNVVTGRACLIIAQAEISGSVTLGDQAYIAPHACIRERLSIGRGAVVGLGAVVVKDVPENVTVAGVPAKVIGLADGPPPPPQGHE